nr:unnamed protein product [Callosobruchus analis]
MKHFPKGP